MERRAHPRYEANDRICITVLPESNADSHSETFYCTTNDLSATGLRFSGASSLKEGQSISMLVVRGHAYWGFSLTGRVVWVRNDGTDPAIHAVGIEFVDMPEPTRIAWHEALERERQNPARSG